MGTKGSVFCNSGSSADLLAINSILKSPTTNLKRGDKVLVPAITWPTQVWSIIQSGLTPILFDCSKGCNEEQHSQNRRSEFIIE